MKQYILSISFSITLILVFSLITTTDSLAQNNDSKIEITTESTSTRNSDDGIINITVKESSNSYSYYVYDKEPWVGGELVYSTEGISESNYSFIGMARGKYYVCVVISEDQTHCQTISIKAN